MTLLLWYKEERTNKGGMGSPIYRIDARTNNNDIAIGQYCQLSTDECYVEQTTVICHV